MDLSDIKHPKPCGHTQYEFNAFGTIPFHTCYPLIAERGTSGFRNIVVALHEALEADCREVYHTPYVLDVKNPRDPRIIGFFPRPGRPRCALHRLLLRRGRFGSHNTPNVWLAPAPDPAIIAISWFNAGIRFSELSNPTAPREVAWSSRLTTETSTSTNMVARHDGKRVSLNLTAT